MSDRPVLLLHSDKPIEEATPLLAQAAEVLKAHPLSVKDWKDELISDTEMVYTYLSDEELKEFIPTISRTNIKIGVLPHPDGLQSKLGYGVQGAFEDALEHLREHPEPVLIDILYCNDRMVFNNVVIGDTFQLVTTGRKATSPWHKRFRYVVGKFFHLRPFGLKVITKKRTFQTAVAGILVVQHGKGSMLSRFILENSFANDGRFHTFLISPRSLAQLVVFAFRSVFNKKRLPPFASHIKTSAITFQAENAFDFSEDGLSQSAKEIKIKIAPQEIYMIPGRYLLTREETEESEEIFKVSNLPMKASAEEMIGKILPFIKHASTEEFQHLFTILRENAALRNSYLMLMVLSTMLATFGIFANSTPVVIGAMILAPLMGPIISLSMAALRQDKQLAIRSGKTIAAGMVAGFACAMAVTWLTPLNTPNAEILSRVRPNLLDLGIAVVSGVAGAYAHAREEIAKTLAGVAIAVALVPPLAVAGIGLAWLDFEIYLGASLLLLTNLAGMVLAGAVTFLVMGFSPFRLARKGVLISLLLVGILSLPLGFSFNRMVTEHNIVARINAHEFEHVRVKEAQVLRLSPLTLGVKVASSHYLTEEELDEIKHSIEQSLNMDAEIEITVAIRR